MALEQNLSDRNNVYLDINIASLDSGVKQSRQGAICIKQATTERVGAMRAQQVLDLNACKSDIKSLQSSASSLQSTIENFNNTISALSNRIISSDSSKQVHDEIVKAPVS